MAIFALKLPSKLAEHNDYDLTVIPKEDRSQIEIAILLFGEKYWGNVWEVKLDEQVYKIRAEDIAFIWEDLPTFTSTCVRPDFEPTFIDIPGQGSELKIAIEPLSTESLYISIITPQDEPLFWVEKIPADTLKAHHKPVSKSIFLSLWLNFINSIITIMIEEGFIKEDDESLNTYLSLLPN